MSVVVSQRAAELHRQRRLADMMYALLLCANDEERQWADGVLGAVLDAMLHKYDGFMPPAMAAELRAVVAGSDRRAKHAFFFMAIRLEEAAAGVLASGPALDRDRLQYFGGVKLVEETDRLLNGTYAGCGGLVRWVDTLRPLYFSLCGLADVPEGGPE